MGNLVDKFFVRAHRIKNEIRQKTPVEIDLLITLANRVKEYLSFRSDRDNWETLAEVSEPEILPLYKTILELDSEWKKAHEEDSN